MTYTSPTRAEAAEQTRQRLLRAARAEFLAKGWRGSTVRSIARRAGHSTGAFFAHFTGKDDAWEQATGFLTPDQWAKDVLKTLSDGNEVTKTGNSGMNKEAFK